ncbi:hypothetical protein HPB48_012720 [Haemaphysalis longicornis]|uniref:Uncharacterized protein n=1 Tax=Haemaphysalis longicornis TaxID=44386 RepID=A0A9J6GR75_HAELO|nr:hypothetical protein HPB48_012720 [Haemaphysalis longicornis]
MDVPFEAYDAVGQNKIRGIIKNARDMTSEELMDSFHCRSCKILQGRPLSDEENNKALFESKIFLYRSARGHSPFVFSRTVHKWMSVIYGPEDTT